MPAVKEQDKAEKETPNNFFHPDTIARQNQLAKQIKKLEKDKEDQDPPKK